MPDAVVDIGNSRIKFCRVVRGQLHLPVRGLATDDVAAWDKLAVEWSVTSGRTGRLPPLTQAPQAIHGLGRLTRREGRCC